MTETRKKNIQHVIELINSGLSSSVIAETLSDKWGVSERQVYNYISDAKKEIDPHNIERELGELEKTFNEWKESDNKYKIWTETDFDSAAVYEIPGDDRNDWNKFLRWGWSQPERVESVIQKDKTGLEKLDEYCESVRAADVEVCKWVRFAVDRHYDNLKSQFDDDFEYYFEPNAALHYIRYFEYKLTHHTGIKAGEPIIFEPWQWFTYGSIFGWLKKKRFHDFALRRFKKADLFFPKKQGKSIISGNTGKYMAEQDGWPGAQCFTIATSQSHAMDLGYRDAVITIEKSPWLQERFDVKKGGATIGIYCPGNNSYYKPVTTDADKEDGYNVHFCGPDETKDLGDEGKDMYYLMEEGMVSAPNGLMMSTSTEGFRMDSLMADQLTYLENVLDPDVDVEDDTLFGVNYTIDDEDRYDEDGKEIDGWWMNLDLYKKANPNYDVSVYEDMIKPKFGKAQASLDKRASLITKHLNVRTSSNSAFIAQEKWNACGTRELKGFMWRWKEIIQDYKGVPCWAGLDLGAVSDFTALELVFEGDIQEVLSFFWIPEDTIADRKNSNLVQRFVDEGYVEATAGDWTDHDYTEECIKEIASVVDLQELVYDRYKMNQMVTHLQDEGIEVTPFGQGYVSMAPAVDHLEDRILQQKIEHFSNPVLGWMNKNISIKKDPAGNRKFDKDKSQDKIDGMTALVMPLYRSSITDDQTLNWEEVTVL